MNTWGGFVEYGLSSSSDSIKRDEEQLPEMDREELQLNASLQLTLNQNANFHELTNMSNAYENIPENGFGANYLPGGIAYEEPISDESSNSEPLHHLTVEDLLSLDVQEVERNLLGYCTIPQIVVTPPATEVKTATSPGKNQQAPPTSTPVSLKPNARRLLPRIASLTPIHSSASSSATSPENEFFSQTLKTQKTKKTEKTEKIQNRKSPSKRRRSHGQTDSLSSTEAVGLSSHKHRCYAKNQKNSDVETDDSYSEFDGGASGCTSNSDASDMALNEVPMDTSNLDEGSSSQYPNQIGDLELCILRQPEANHRARYRTEGSRGCVKDRTGISCPTVQLKGVKGNESAVLQVFAGNEASFVQPHHLYRVSKAGGKKTTPCRETILDGVNMIEMDFHSEDNWIVKADCLGIMKLRNTDIKLPEMTLSAKSKKPKRSRKLRLVFQAIVTDVNNQTTILRAVSTPLSCTPLPGVPEIHHVSHQDGDVIGGLPIVIIGRNFTKDESKFYVIEKCDGDTGKIAWEREIPLHPEYFQSVHVVGIVPPYHNPHIIQPVNVYIVVRNKGKQSEPFKFRFVPSKPRSPSGLPVVSSVLPTSIGNNVIQLSVQPDRHNPNGHVIIISVPSSKNESFLTKNDQKTEKMKTFDQQSCFLLGDLSEPVGGALVEQKMEAPSVAESVFDLDDSKKHLQDYNNQTDESSQQLFNELLRDILGRECC